MGAAQILGRLALNLLLGTQHFICATNPKDSSRAASASLLGDVWRCQEKASSNPSSLPAML